MTMANKITLLRQIDRHIACLGETMSLRNNQHLSNTYS